MSNFAGITNEHIDAAYDASVKARHNLTFHIDPSATSNRVTLDDLQALPNGCEGTRFFPKVCAICDKLMKPREEFFIDIKKFSDSIVRHIFRKDIVAANHQSVYGVSPMSTRTLTQYYTQNYFRPVFASRSNPLDADQKQYNKDVAFLNTCILSPRSYGRYYRKKYQLACCKMCSNGMKNLLQENSSTTSPPKFSIVNGMMIGRAPAVLRILNDVELALVSLIRVHTHLFQYSGGVHKSIKGYHTFFTNNTPYAYGVMNEFIHRQNDDSSVNTEENYIDEAQEADDPEQEHDDLWDDIENDIQNGSSETGNGDGGRTMKIFVVLTGKFTPRQLEITKKKTLVNPRRVRAALNWLKRNNVLYKDVDIDEKCRIQPEIIDCKDLETSGEGSNIEKTFEVTSIFPDSNKVLSFNGGQRTTEEFKKKTLQRLLAGTGDINEVLIAQSSSTVVRDYVDANLCKAFPRNFPYGIGYMNRDYEHRTGGAYLQHLLSLSTPEFHKATFSTVIYNMYEIQKMVRNSYLKVSDSQKCAIAGIDNESLDIAIQDYLTDGENIPGATHPYNQPRANGHVNDNPAKMFLQKIHATTQNLSHSKSASDQARQNMYAFIARFGQPAIMFTITPEDSANFRINIMSEDGRFGCCQPPAFDTQRGDFQDSVQDFMLHCSNIRTEYPSLSAFDFENIIDITIWELLGWDANKKVNIPKKGIFGDIDCFTMAVEEQGRGTLHAHFLVWLPGWNDLQDGLADPSQRANCANLLTEFGSKIMSCSLHSNTYQTCQCTTSLSAASKCTLNDLRRLRTAKLETSLGGRKYMKCVFPGCDTAYCSNALAALAVDRSLNVTFDSNEPLMARNTTGSMRRMLMELHIMKEFIAHQKRNIVLPRTSRRYLKNLFVTNALRNLHSSDHAASCFKKKNHECRMKLPKPESQSTNIHFQEHPKNWYSWKGINEPRQMFIFEQERAYQDAFVNTSSEIASLVFGCNTNIIFAVSGGSIMYLTCYVSKNTQKDDNKDYTAGAKIMIEKISDQLKELTDADNSNNPDEPDLLKAGMRAVIGASLIATKSHICSAPMAAYISRNTSRFRYSHEIQPANMNHFSSEEACDYSIDADDEGYTFITSKVLNYYHRPKSYEDICLYDILSRFRVRNLTQDERSETQNRHWFGNHPSPRYQKMVNIGKNKTDMVPKFTYRDFPNTKWFGGKPIDSIDLSFCSDGEIQNMENYAKKASILFRPHRCLNDLKAPDGTFLTAFRLFLSNPPERFTTFHSRILKNIQDCHNSMNLGRIPDVLENSTDTPELPEGQSETNEDSTDPCSELLDAFLHADNSLYENFTHFRTDNSNFFTFRSSLVRDTGKIGCGKHLLTLPLVDPNSTVFPQSQTSDNTILTSPSTPTWTRKTNAEINRDRDNLYKLRQTRSERVTQNGKSRVKPNGTLDNIRLYAEDEFGTDRDQIKAFTLIVAAFLAEMYTFGGSRTDGQRSGSRYGARDQIKEYQRLNNNGQFVAFLSGAGGTGKSRVINAVLAYAKELCRNARISFDKRTIVVTALTGSAAVSIFGETTHSACHLNRKIGPDQVLEWANTRMLIVDEISFASESNIQTLNENLNLLKETDSYTSKFGGIPVLFAGDFTQLEPVRAQPLFLNTSNLWYETVTTFIELKTNHRFAEDPQWGSILQRLREDGGTAEDLEIINSRVVSGINGLHEHDIPRDAVYATKDNIDRSAINDGIFAKFLADTHSTDPDEDPPLHTLCIKASNLSFKEYGSRYYEENKAQHTADLIYSSCGDGHVKTDNSKRLDPLLKLFFGRKLYINDNIDVSSCIANGAMCSFVGITILDGHSIERCLEKIVIDGFYVNCIEAKFIKSFTVQMIDGVVDPSTPRYIDLQPSMKYSCLIKLPVPWDGPITKTTHRVWKRAKFNQIPVNIADARTVHKLQGRSVRHLVVSNWDYTGNWVYVVLSRCSSLSGLFLRRPLLKTRPMSDANRFFHSEFRNNRSPPTDPDY